MEVREMVPADTNTILMGLKAFKRELPYPQEAIMTEPEARKFLTETLTSTQWKVYLAQDDEILAGFCMASVVGHPLMPRLRAIKEWALWIRPAYRNSTLLSQFTAALKAAVARKLACQPKATSNWPPINGATAGVTPSAIPR